MALVPVSNLYWEHRGEHGEYCVTPCDICTTGRISDGSYLLFAVIEVDEESHVWYMLQQRFQKQALVLCVCLCVRVHACSVIKAPA